MTAHIIYQYNGKRFHYTFDNKLNLLIGNSATGKSFIQHAVKGKCYKDTYNNALNAEVYTGYENIWKLGQIMGACHKNSLVILDEMFIKALHTQEKLNEFIESAEIIVVISRYAEQACFLPFGIRQIYTVKVDGNYSKTAHYFSDWIASDRRIHYLSEDSTSGNEVWERVLSCSVKKGTGIYDTLAAILADSELFGCIDTLSISSAFLLFETLYNSKATPLFNVPSVEYLLAQALLSPQEVDEIIYSEINSERACTELVKDLTEGRYNKSKTTTLLCPTHCTECRSRTCKGKQINIIDKIHSYLKDIHPEYNFPWESNEVSYTNKFKGR
ncbi:MAG: hypothetical protein RSC43_01245 [Clostridia bacterium]